MDMFNFLGKINDMQEKIQSAKERLKMIPVMDSSRDNLVQVKMTASLDLQKIEISDELMKNHSRAEIEDLLTTTVKNAIAKAKIKAEEQYKEELEGTIPNLPGFELKDNLPFL